MYKIFFLSLSIISLPVIGQKFIKTDKFIDESGSSFYYEEINKIENTSKVELKKRVELWNKNKLGLKILLENQNGKVIDDTFDSRSFDIKGDPFFFGYNLSIYVKDNSYRIFISNIHTTYLANERHPHDDQAKITLEELIEYKDQKKWENIDLKGVDFTIGAMNDNLKDLSESIKSYMIKKIAKKDDW